MSTKKIREALGAMKSRIMSGEPWTLEMEQALQLARGELEAIEEAARFMASTSQDQNEAQRHMTTMERIAEETR